MYKPIYVLFEKSEKINKNSLVWTEVEDERQEVKWLKKKSRFELHEKAQWL